MIQVRTAPSRVTPPPPVSARMGPRRGSRVPALQLALAAAAAAASALPASPPIGVPRRVPCSVPRAHVECGWVRGACEGDGRVAAFRGIPCRGWAAVSWLSDIGIGCASSVVRCAHGRGPVYSLERNNARHCCCRLVRALWASTALAASRTYLL